MLAALQKADAGVTPASAVKLNVLGIIDTVRISVMGKVRNKADSVYGQCHLQLSWILSVDLSPTNSL